MIVLGLLLMAACVGLAADAVIENTSLVSGTVLDRSVTDVSLGTVFVSGAVLGLLFTLGLLMLAAGIGRSARRRRERATLRERQAELDAYPADSTTTADTDAGRHRLSR